jgi:hypothetical protein
MRQGMKVSHTFCLVLLLSALILSAACTSQQAATVMTPVPTTRQVITTAVPGTSEQAIPATTPVIRGSDIRGLLVDKAWKVRSWQTEPDLDMKNARVQSFLADYNSHANNTFTWYNNGTLVYRYANGTAFTTGTWNLTKNNTVIEEKYTSSDGFYLESKNEIRNISVSTFVIRYPAMIDGKEYFFIETQGI